MQSNLAKEFINGVLSIGKYNVKGFSYLKNNQIQNGNFENNNYWYSLGSSTFSIFNNKCVISPVSGTISGVYNSGFIFNNNHKYLFISSISSENDTQITIDRSGTVVAGYNVTSEKQTFYTIYHFTSSAGTRTLRYYNNSGINFTLYNVKAIDLTILDAKLADTTGLTPEMVIAKYPNILNWEYGVGTIKGMLSPFKAYIGTREIPFNIKDLNGHDLELNGINTVKDTWENTQGILDVMLGSVDLGTLNWNSTSSPHSFRTRENTIPSVHQTLGLLCTNGYSVFTNYTDVDSNNMSMAMYNVSQSKSLVLRIRDDRYSSLSGFKEAMDGVILDYELESPYSLVTNSVMLPKGITKIVDANGIEVDYEEI